MSTYDDDHAQGGAAVLNGLPASCASAHSPGHGRRGARIAATATMAMCAGLLLAPPATPEPAPNLTEAVNQVRGAGQCGSLQYDPITEHTAEIVNRSTDAYISHTARSVPVSDPLPIFRDLGGAGGKAISLQGAGPNDGDAIKGLLLQGYAAIPDCSYTSFGTSMLWNADAGMSLATVVLIGP